MVVIGFADDGDDDDAGHMGGMMGDGSSGEAQSE